MSGIVNRLLLLFWVLGLCACSKDGPVDDYAPEDTNHDNDQVRLICDANTILAQRVDCYASHIKKKVQRYWVYPDNASDSNYVVEIKLFLDRWGFPLKTIVVRESGNRHFDASVLRAIEVAKPFPVPDELDVYAAEFTEVNMMFHLK